MQIVDKQITLTGTAINLTTTAFADSVIPSSRCAAVRFTPDNANTHIVNVMGPNGNVIKQLEKPPAADGDIDEFEIGLHSGENVVNLSQLSVNGTNGEKVNVTAFVR